MKTAAEAHPELHKVYGGAAVSETTCRDWFRLFRDGDFDVDDRPRGGRPKSLKTLNWRHCSMRIHAKRNKSLHQH
ncbi:putative SET domain and mariner transposase fusion protein [Trypoxylus dichotomus]